MKKSLLIAAGLLASGVLVATAASASPLGGLATATPPLEAGLVQLVHDGNVHRVCLLGQRGWHYHNRYGDRIECRPRRPGLLYWTWRTEGGRTGWWHSRDRRWN